ncbi:CPBP family intramembrane metalloprotease [Propionibacterium australiense]|nr:CPBP family intramembrane metalloprotease [Propionibacterium australiense]RLP08333.1 CPBP family intramembrane metalloprotease [Propionibacterium australiense]
MWGHSIVTSTTAYLSQLEGTETADESLEFAASDNYGALAMQAVLLLLALAYLWMRRFDFRTWHVRLSPKALVQGILVFLGGALLMDAYLLITSPLTEILPIPGPIGAFFGNETVSKVIYSLLNGFYEEIYFLGICLAVKPHQLKWAVPFSLLVRASFHTYQGMINALGIGVLFGGLIYLLYKRSKDKNLLPFFIAHAMGDIFGVGLVSYFWT